MGEDQRCSDVTGAAVTLADALQEENPGVVDVSGAYLHLSDDEFRSRIKTAYQRLLRCDLCPRHCGARRLSGATGYCGAALRPRVFVSNLHRGEEPPVSGTVVRGTVFLSGCNLNCCYCQNYPLSQLHHGTEMSTASLASALIDLQARGAHNINVVTPSHQVPQILAAVFLARRLGLHVPLVYNTSSYDELSTLKLLDGVVDIYLADLRLYGRGYGRGVLRRLQLRGYCRESARGDAPTSGRHSNRCGRSLRSAGPHRALPHPPAPCGDGR